MGHYTQGRQRDTPEISIASIDISNAQVQLKHRVLSRFTALTKRSASRVGRGMRVPSATLSAKRRAVSKETRWPCETYTGLVPARVRNAAPMISPSSRNG